MKDREEYPRRKRATAVIIRDGNVLLFRRVKPEKEYYAFPGGNVEKGESAENALVREIREELNLTIKSLRPLCIIENVRVPRFASAHKDSCDYVCFLVDGWEGVPELGGPEKERNSEVNQYHIEWISLSKLGKIVDVYPRDLASKLMDEKRV